jgi:transcriptional adapter 2-alpha
VETLDCDKNPVPTESFIKSSSSNEQDFYAPNSALNRIPVVPRYTLGEKVERDKGKETKAKDKAEIQQKIGTLPGSDLTGFIPLREDFDIEYENDAELMLADMEFNPDDHPSEKELKLQVIQIYNHKLTERDRRKRFVIDRGLIDNKKQMSLDRKRTKEERELVAKLRVFARFHTAAEHEALVEGMLKARRLRQQISLYQHYRRMGIRTLDQARSYEIDRKKRETEMKSRKQGKDAPYAYETGRQSGPGLTSKKGKRRGGDEEEDKKSDSNALDISKAPGAELLADKEIDLCARVPMLPMHYLAAKDAIVREAYRNGTLTSEGVKRVLKLDASKTDKIFDFFVREMTLPLSEDEKNLKRARNSY